MERTAEPSVQGTLRAQSTQPWGHKSHRLTLSGGQGCHVGSGAKSASSPCNIERMTFILYFLVHFVFSWGLSRDACCICNKPRLAGWSWLLWGFSRDQISLNTAHLFHFGAKNPWVSSMWRAEQRGQLKSAHEILVGQSHIHMQPLWSDHQTYVDLDPDQGGDEKFERC